MGFLLGWIYRRRWLTLIAFAALLAAMAGVFITKGNGWWIGPLAGIFVAVSLYEGLRGVTTRRQPAWMEAALPLWMGAWITSLSVVPQLLPPSTSSSFVATFAVVCAVGLVGAILISLFGIIAARRQRSI